MNFVVLALVIVTNHMTLYTKTCQVGLPAKSGVSGAVLLVVPNVMGVMCWSPPVDKVGNSVRGIHFCQVFQPSSHWFYTLFLIPHHKCSLNNTFCNPSIIRNWCLCSTSTIMTI